MKMYLFQIGSLKIPGYGFMIGIGFLIALALGELRARRKKMNDDFVIDVAITAILSGFLGGKLLFIIVEFKNFLKRPLTILGSSGFVVYGGIIIAILSCILLCRIKKKSFLAYFDLCAPEVALAQGFGRIGCFLAGCCYGKVTDSPIGVVFPANSQALSGVPLIPTQLISSGLNFLSAIFLIVLADFVFKDFKYRSNLSKREHIGKSLAFGHVQGDIATLYMFLYAVGRFIIEFFRADDRGSVGVLSTSQFIAIFMAIGALCFFFINRKLLLDKRAKMTK